MLVKNKETCMQSKLSVSPKFCGGVRQMMVKEASKNGFCIEGGGNRIRTNETDDLVLAGILAVFKGSDHPQSFTLSSEKAAIVFERLEEMTRKGDKFKLAMPNPSRGAKFFRGYGHFTIVPVDARPNQLAIVYEFPESAAMFYNA